MLRFIISLILPITITACSVKDWGIVHRIDVQQGNVITQEMVDQLQPGMSRRQVQYITGSPMVVDVFHQDRWDFVYRFSEGHSAAATEHVTLHFEDNALTRITGTLKPADNPTVAADTRAHETHVVPPQDRSPPGILNRFWRWITFQGGSDDTS